MISFTPPEAMNSPSFWTAYWILHVIIVLTVFLFSNPTLVSYVTSTIPLTSRLFSIIKNIKHYGKTLKEEDYWKNVHVPKKWFTHFYVIGTIVNLILILSYHNSSLINHEEEQPVQKESSSFLPLLLKYPIILQYIYQIQVTRRLFECLFVSRFSSTAKIHLLHYILGVSYYFAVPLTIRCCVLATERNIEEEERHLLVSPYTFLVGFLLFLYANYMQYDSHAILASLRSPNSTTKQQKASSTTAAPNKQTPSYKIPKGGWFKYVSCPHYTAEILVYISLVIMVGNLNMNATGPMSALLLFVMVELSFNATNQHEWYLEKFKDYPLERRAIIPFLW